MNPTADYVPLISLPIEWEWALMKTGQILAICILLLISLATPWVSETVREKWFAMPAFLALLPIPLISVLALAGLAWVLISNDVSGINPFTDG